MTSRLALLALAALLAIPATAKDKKKSVLPEDILRAQTVRVMVDPDAGEPLDQPQANAYSESEQNGIGSTAHQAEVAAQLVQRATEQRKACRRLSRDHVRCFH